MVLTIKRLTPTVTPRYRTGEGATGPARLERTASAKSAPPVEIVRPAEAVWLVVLGGSKLNRARRNAPANGTRSTTGPPSQGLTPNDADTIHKKHDRGRYAQADHIH
jgi:hypothetical protein